MNTHFKKNTVSIAVLALCVFASTSAAARHGGATHVSHHGATHVGHHGVTHVGHGGAWHGHGYAGHGYRHGYGRGYGYSGHRGVWYNGGWHSGRWYGGTAIVPVGGYSYPCHRIYSLGNSWTECR